MDYQAKLKVPFGVLGIRCSGAALTGIDFLPAGEKPQRATNAFAQTVCEQLRRYQKPPEVHAPLDLPVSLDITAVTDETGALQRCPEPRKQA